MFVFARESETKKSVAVNSKNVLYIEEDSSGTVIFLNGGTQLKVLDNYLHFYNMLNEQKCDCC